IMAAIVRVVFPKVLGEPRTAAAPASPEGAVDGARHTPEVCVVMRYPTPRSVHHTRSLLSRHGEFTYHAKKRLVQFTEIGALRGPRVHLRVDVDGILAVPRRIHPIVPDTLQVRRLTAGLGRRDQQITPELKIQCRKVWIICCGEVLQ